MFLFFSRRCARALTAAILVLLLGACGSDDHDVRNFIESSSPGAPEPVLSGLFAYRPQSPYAGVLAGCVAADEETACTLGALPLLGQRTAAPSLEDVMNRVVVSHPWMGERFEELLETLPPDLLTLFKGVTAVVIADGIRPSFYTTLTGAVYLDPANFWLTDEERRTIFQEEDFRSGFGNGLQFISLWRYVKGNAYASRYYDLSVPASRPLSSIRYEAAALLYHELAHANDYFPSDRIAALSGNDMVFAATAGLQGSRIHDRLTARFPLTSGIWSGLAAVLYRGTAATPAQQSYSPLFVGTEFEQDGASDDYAYAHPAEDVAMLFEELMMKYHFDVDREIAFAPAVTAPNPTCADVSVTWGNRNRLGDPEVRERARLVAAELLPGQDMGSFITLMPTPSSLPSGWCLDQPVASALGLSAEAAPPRSIRRDLLPPHAR